MKLIHKIIVVLILPRRPMGRVKQAQAIVQAMTGNARFPNPTPTLAQIQGHIQDVVNAEAVAQSRAKGTKQTRDERLDVLTADLGHLRDYVQGIVEANPEDGEAAARSAGMSVRKLTPPTRSEFEARQGSRPGEAVLIVKRGANKRACYNWSWSTDQKTWISLPTTLQAKTTVANLTPGTTCYFRFQAVTRTGASEWSSPVSLDVK